MSNAAAKARRNKILKIVENENSEEKKTDSTQRTIIDTEKDEEFKLDPNFNVFDAFDENNFDENSLFCHEILNNSDNEQSDNKSKSNKFDLSLLNSDDSTDKDYIPDSCENSSDDENLTTKIDSNTPYVQNRAEKRKKNTQNIKDTPKKIKTESCLLLRPGKDLTKVGKLRNKRKFEERLPQLPRRIVNVLSNTKATIIPTQDTISKARIDKESTKRKENILTNIDLKPPTQENERNRKAKKKQIFQEITQPENQLVQNRDQQTQLKENIQRSINNERVLLADSLQESKDTEKPIPQKRENIIKKNNTFEEESVQQNRDTKIPTLQKEDMEQLENENSEKSNDDPPIIQEEEILNNIDTESPINSDSSFRPDPEKLNCPNNEIQIPQEEEIVSNVEVQQPEATSDFANNQQRETGLLQNINIVKKTIDIEQLEKEKIEKLNDDPPIIQEEEMVKNIDTESPINSDNLLPDSEKFNCPINEIQIPQEEEIVSNVEVQQPEATSDFANNQQRETGLLQNINIVKKTIDIEQLEKEKIEKLNDDPPIIQEEEMVKNIDTESPINSDNLLPDSEKLNCPINEIQIPQEEEIVSNVEVQQPEVTSDFANNQQREQQAEEDIGTAGLGLTKTGKPRKRRKFDKSVEERKAEKKQEYEEKHSIKSPCDIRSCKKKCTSNITEEQRKEIHATYTNLNWEAQGLFIKCLVEEKPVARRVQSSKEGDPRRTTTYKYFLKSTVTNLPRTEVCKTFFLSTLGYKANNDTRLMTALKKAVDKQTYERGKYERTNKIDKEVVVNHIMNYSPCISHYRREHAPKKLYLPSDITITLMHKQFLAQYPDLSVSFEYYRKVVTKDLNISFAQLGNEECEQCAYYKMHDTNHTDNPDETCEICVNYLSHKVRYRQTRAAYKSDVEIATEDETSIYYSVDLQKVVMLPRIDQYKAAIFCPRIIAFNESFVPLGSTDSQNVPYAAVWNETISGRCREDIISAFRAFLIYKRDIENIVLWLDNCAAQNKNWALLSFLVNIINSNMISAKTVTIKYFEPGHTFMSADSFHHQVELSLKRKEKVYDFEDFLECVRMSNSKKNFVKNMAVSDFFDYQDFSSQHKLKKISPRVYLKDIMCVKVERGLYGLKYKTNHSDDYYNSLDFLQAKIIKNQQFPDTTPKTRPRGTTEERKREIIAKLVPLMPENRRQFWRDLPTSTSSADLSQEE